MRRIDVMFQMSLLMATTAALAAEPQFALSLEAASSQLIAGDPLLVKVVLTNIGDEEQMFRVAPCFDGYIGIEIHRPESDRFLRCHNVREKGEGWGGLIAKILPQESCVDYDFLLPAENPFLCLPGEYQIRAKLRSPYTPEIFEIWSPVINIRVSPRSPNGHIALITSTELTWGTIAGIYSDTSVMFSKVRVDALASLESQLTASHFRTVLIWTRMIREYDPDNPCSQQQLDAIENVRKTLDPITSDVISLRLAARLATHKQWQLALDELDKIDDSNAQIESDRTSCRYYLDLERDAGGVGKGDKSN